MKRWFGSKSELTDLQKGNQFLVAKDYAAAIECFFRHAHNFHEDAPKAYTKIAGCYLRTNTLPEPKEFAPGITLVSQGDRRSAEYYYRLALQHDPDYFAALKGLADTLSEKSEERCELLERAVAKQPGALILVDLGDFYRTYRKDFHRAYELYRQAQEHAPKDKTAYQRLSNMCRRLGRPDEAKQWAEKWREMSKRKWRFDSSRPE